MARLSMAPLLLFSLLVLLALLGGLSEANNNDTFPSQEEIVAEILPWKKDEGQNPPKPNPPNRVDVRCRYQKVDWVGTSPFLVYKIFVAPHNNDLPDLCKRIQEVVMTQCLSKRGQTLGRHGYIKFGSCLGGSRDEMSSMEGYATTIRFKKWNTGRDAWNNDQNNTQCVQNAIWWAVNGCVIDWADEGKCAQVFKEDYTIFG